MMMARKSAHRRRGHRAPWLLALGMLIILVGCAPGPQSVVPAELPLTTYQDIFVIRWALQRDPTVTRAAGLIETKTTTPAQVELSLFGLDANGRIVSRAISWVRPSSFSSLSLPFSVELTPTGQEVKYELRVIDYRLPNMRSN
jgi:hypothetical protein